MIMFNAFRKEWSESIRTYRLLVVSVVLVFFGLTSPLLTKFTPELLKLVPMGQITVTMPPQTVSDSINQYVKNMGQFGIILALLLTMGVVAQEKDKGTAAMMLVKPMPRGVFLGAKFLGLLAMFAFGLALAAIASYYYTYLLFEAMDPIRWLMLNAFILVYVLVFVSITLFASTLTRSQISAGGIALGIMVILGLAGALPSLARYLPGELIAWGVRLLNGDTTTSWAALGISLGLIVVPLVAAWLVFRRQEL